MSTQLTAFEQTSGNGGFATGTVNNIFATNIIKLTLTKTEQFWIGSRKTGQTVQATGVEDNLNLFKSLMTLFDY